MYPTARLITILVLCVALSIVLALAWPQGWVWAPLVMLGVLGLSLFDGLFAPLSRTLTLDLKTPRTMGVGRDYVWPFTLSFSGRRPGALEVRFGANHLLIVSDTAQAITDNEGAFHAELALKAHARGVAVLEDIHVRYRGVLGLIWIQKRLTLDRQIVVTPDIEGVQHDASELFSYDSIYGVRVQNQLHNGSEFHALREYDASQDPRRIDWRSSARHLKLLSREFQAERNHHIVLAFDTGRLMGEPLLGIKRLDRALYAGLLLGYCALKIGDNIRSFAFASQPYHIVPQVSGMQGYEVLKHQLSSLSDMAEESNHTLALADLNSRIGRRSLIVLFTDFIDEISADLMLEALNRLSKKHVIIFVAFRDEVLEDLAAKPPHTPGDVSRAIFAQRLLTQRETVHALLRRQGIEVLEAPTEQMATLIVTKYLALKQADRL
ncbi:DUF58 domain-containing protein [Asticcacaulis machinosus]|uniref:DUF58 domain-containing protein n=1 Tax=Asticcacaulis machinosus TaxID=2984211 RepID=A0ABT5HKT7_9CAUL|nr:DUF58 domain-containing protein [Asticcacaulis machinosus]MDC7676598.1 DUF58 domain-containing protein [Asticcacaulis machinosus]